MSGTVLNFINISFDPYSNSRKPSYCPHFTIKETGADRSVYRDSKCLRLDLNSGLPDYTWLHANH